MKTLQLKQGSPEWLEHRSTHLNASDAPVMLGLSSYRSRDDLLTEKKTGVMPVIDAHTQRIFDKGHEFEAMARPIAEKTMIKKELMEDDDDLFSSVGSMEFEGLKLSASFDGLPEFSSTNWEHKSINDTLRALTCIEDLDEQYKVQMEQQLMLCGGDKCLFMASNGTEEDMVYFIYEKNLDRRKTILQGWKQFNKDLETFVVPEKAEVLVGKAVEELPALLVQVTGSVISTNIDAFKAAGETFLNQINTELVTDQDFADAEKAIKACVTAEKQIDSVREHSVGQMVDVSAVFKAMDFVKEEIRTTRLKMEKLVKAEKANIKNAIIGDVTLALDAHVRLTNKEFGVDYILSTTANFAGVIKGKRSIESIKSAVNDELARVKIEINDIAQTIRINLKFLTEKAEGHRGLFNDLSYIIQKDSEDFTALVQVRISNFEKEKAEAKEKEDARVALAKEAISKTEPETVTPVSTITPSEPEAKPEPIVIGETTTQEDRLRRYADNIQAAVQSVPFMEDEKLKKYLTTRVNRLLSIVDEIYEKAEKKDEAA